MVKSQMHLTTAQTSTGTSMFRRSKIRVVVVDDEPISRATIAMLLRKEESFEMVGSASSGTEAVTLIRQSSPDLLFLDVDMPGMDGFQVLECAKEKVKPAVIFVTSNEVCATKAFEVEAVDYLLKPLTRERFKLALQRAKKRLVNRVTDVATV